MNKTVLITGAAKGIGKQIAIDFKNAGYNVCITYNKSENEAKEMKENLDIDIYQLDITKKHDIDIVIDQIVSKYGKIDCLVNNAGICDYSLFTDISEDTFINMINTNLTSVFNITKSVLNKTMIREKNGSIINISSIWGITGSSCEVHYSTSKAGVIGMTKSLAKELGLSNITVNSIAPGVIETDMIGNLSEDDLNELKMQIPLNRIGNSSDISGMAVFLASDNARYITGQVITIDGGMCI
ncbi:MAG: 3-oxoacyl-ACP reductase FabG [Clostridia bacterium]|nr:3-oxoacyl-ACP reductase FabG [Clostridia bacterium]MDD4386769.1 3-oxoacyl-ACP reductase FabG [Clostridia bacterium]